MTLAISYDNLMRLCELFVRINSHIHKRLVINTISFRRTLSICRDVDLLCLEL